VRVGSVLNARAPSHQHEVSERGWFVRHEPVEKRFDRRKLLASARLRNVLPARCRLSGRPYPRHDRSGRDERTHPPSH
jgi:hypothetical protein